MTLSEINKISIAEICVYVPALLIASFLAFRHGFGRSAGWLYLILFSLCRIIGAAFDLASISDPTNTNLYVGYFTLQSIGLGPLILVMLGLLTRVLESVTRATRGKQGSGPLVNQRNLRIVQVVVMVALILGIVGGTEVGDQISDVASGESSSYSMPMESKAGVALMIAGYGLLVLAAASVGAHSLGDVEQGEKRLLGAIFLALPFVLVRLIFSGLSTFTSNPNFRLIGGSASYPDYFLGMSVVMEMAAITVFEAVGLSLQQRPKEGGRSIPMTRYGGLPSRESA
ncbi:hypothetical protein NKR23_g2458 [Pleurostoma richardsiae]|uniref:DUF7702 domain-containing protein n=1 Tax=Pleurostoma richardsiae TaxID=41990 RepID=A0AA38VIG8_9PEZI|nr:hypothetical protein NKR23_g2458 [Pleurostoma richardsiae]